MDIDWKVVSDELGAKARQAERAFEATTVAEQQAIFAVAQMVLGGLARAIEAGLPEEEG